MSAPARLTVSCVSYLAAIHTINVVEHPKLNYGASIVSQDHYLAADGPLTAAALRAFGHDVRLAANQVADDPAGRAVRARLHQWDLPLLPGPPIPAATRTNTVICDAAGNRTGLFDLAGIADELASVDIEAVTSADVVYLDAYEVLGQAPAPILDAALQTGIRTVINLGGSPLPDWLRATVQARRRADILQTNGPEHDLDAVDALLRRLAAANLADLVIVTAGRHGAWAQSAAGQRWRAAALAVDVRQPQGAGAAFSAGLIHTWDTGQAIAARLRFACAAGSLWCTRATSDPLPTYADVAAALTP